MNASVTRFHPTDELSPILSVEASAGTGKTYALAGLATRLLAEGVVTAQELLVVTFTRAATAELRSRVRARVAESADHLAEVLAGRAGHPDDQLLVWLGSDGGQRRVHERHGRLERALSDFDAATITTIHGFSAQVLAALGVGSGVPDEIAFVEDGDEAVVEACTDVLATAAADPGLPGELPSWHSFHGRVKQALSSADIDVRPSRGECGDDDAELLASLVRQAVEVIRRRRRDSGTQSFDDLLVRLREALRSVDGGATATLTLRHRYGAALIDEFQDTDPIQWEIFRTLFPAHGPVPGSAGTVEDRSLLVLVGDPKQAIYSFRGADVHTYTDAIRRTPGLERRTLDTNWRSDGPAVDVVDAFFTGIDFGPDIPFGRVTVADEHAGGALWRIDGDGGRTPMHALELRCGTGEDLVGDRGSITADTARGGAFADLVRHTVGLLDSCELFDADEGRVRRVRPGDMAVLVRNNDHAAALQDILVSSGVPAVLARGDSVLDSPAARQLRWLLEAMVRPSDQRRARTFALSWFGGWTPAQLADAADPDLLGLQEMLHGWNNVLAGRGVAEFLREVWDRTSVVVHVLAGSDGDRGVTDLEHLGQLLRAGVGDQPASAAGLLGVLDGLRRGVMIQADTDRDTDVTSRRVESDAEAVQIMTVWVSKGLEFPIVLCPTLWSGRNAKPDYHDPDTDVRTFDVRSLSELRKVDPEAAELAEREHAEEDMRLLYVALTRARHHTALWWVDSSSAGRSALAKVLFARDGAGMVDRPLLAATSISEHLPDRTETVSHLRPLADRCGSAMVVGAFGAPSDEPPLWEDQRDRVDSPMPRAAVFERPTDQPLDRSRSRLSFSAIVSRDTTEGDPWDLSIDDEGADDEQRPPDVGLPDGATEQVPTGWPARATTAQEDGRSVGAGSSALAWLPAGAAFGTLAHDVLERVDFHAPDLRSEVARVVDEQQRWRSLSLRAVNDPRPAADPSAQADGSALLAEGLTRAIETPLGPVLAATDGEVRRLRDLSTSDRLDELGFELPLGDHVDGPSPSPPTDRDLGELLASRLAPADPFLPWAEQLARGAFRVELAGHLTGSIDAVLRLRDVASSVGSQTDRFVVVDYKTNRLHDHGSEPLPGDYGRASMRRSMAEHHYPLQALLYMVALHRYLRWRLPGYEPQVNLGGAAYLFLRGMTGEGVRTVDGLPDGVLTWSPPAAAVVDVSDLLGGRHGGSVERR